MSAMLCKLDFASKETTLLFGSPNQDEEERRLHVVNGLAANLLDTLIGLHSLTKSGGDKARKARNLRGAHDENVCLG